MYYIEKGLGQKWLAVIFSVFCLFASFGIGSVAQVNGISTALKGSFNIPGVVTGIVVCALIAVIIYGGLKRIVTVTEKFVPFMAAFLHNRRAYNNNRKLPPYRRRFRRDIFGGVQYALRRRRRYGIRYFKSYAFRCGARSIF